jgi:hypothetical protein
MKILDSFYFYFAFSQKATKTGLPPKCSFYIGGNPVFGNFF